MTTGLAALEARLRQDLEWLELPAKPWVLPSVAEAPVTDVAVIGAGMCGLAVGAQLRLSGIDNIRVLDRAPEGQEGPWVTYARMATLRSPKTLSGPALGLPALTFRAWYTAQHGEAAWEALGKIPRSMWMDYLVWFRHAMRVPVENGVAMTALRPRTDGLLALETSAGPLLARRVVLATGRDGLGGPWLPEVARQVRPERRAHSADAIDFAALAGKRVVVVGAGASAFDNAAAALEAGCGSLTMLVRRAALPAVNKFTGIGSQGVVHGFAGLSDEWKWHYLHYVLGQQTPPPRDSVLRVARHAQARMLLGATLDAVRDEADAVRIATPRGEVTADFVIFATGFGVDLSQRPELAAVAPHIRFWRDRFATEQRSAELEHSPDLAADFSFQEKTPGACPALSRIHCFTYPATLSAGKLSGDIPAVSAGVQRLVRGIARAFFVEDRAQHFERLQAYDVPELLGDEWPEASA